jgi:cytochrome c553
MDSLKSVLLGGILAASAALAGPSRGRSPCPRAPAWAYPVLPSTAPPAAVPDDGVKHRLAGSRQAFTRAELFDLFAAHDWFPESHPPMPWWPGAAHPRCGPVACAITPTARGGPRTRPWRACQAVVQQMHDYQAGLRRSAAAQAGPHLRMVAAAVHLDEADLPGRSGLFLGAALPALDQRGRDRSSASHPGGDGLHVGRLARAGPGAHRPAHRRGAQGPVPDRMARSPVGFTAYVPRQPGRGRQIALQGEGGVSACVSCHGPGLKGLGLIPPLAGRSAQTCTVSSMTCAWACGPAPARPPCAASSVNCRRRT